MVRVQGSITKLEECLKNSAGISDITSILDTMVDGLSVMKRKVRITANMRTVSWILYFYLMLLQLLLRGNLMDVFRQEKVFKKKLRRLSSASDELSTWKSLTRRVTREICCGWKSVWNECLWNIFYIVATTTLPRLWLDRLESKYVPVMADLNSL